MNAAPRTSRAARLTVWLAAVLIGLYTLGFSLYAHLPEGESLRARIAALTLQTADLLPALAAFLLVLGLGLSLCRERSSLLSFLDRHRYALAGGLLLLLTLLRISGSSVSAWAAYLDVPEVGLLFGKPRVIRGDEFAVWTPFTVSQALSGYPAVNPRWGLGTDAVWISVGGAPALSPALLLKPLYWGFFLFGVERGFAFLWNARWILLFLLTDESFRRLTRGNRRLSLIAALMVTLSPYVQWWFSQSVAEVILLSEALVLCFHAWLRAEGGRRLALSALGAWLLGCYIMIAYPGWLIANAWLIAALCLCIALRERRRVAPRDLLSLLPFAALAGLIAMILLRSADTLTAVANSAYPGARLITGGEGLPRSLRSGFGQVLSVFGLDSNASSGAGFPALFPLGELLAGCVLLRARRRGERTEPLLLAGLLLRALTLIFPLIGFPPFLAQGTGFSQIKPERLALLGGELDLLLLFRSLALLPPLRPARAAALAGAAFAAGLLWETGSLAARLIGGFISAGLLAAAFFALSSRRRETTAAWAALTLAAMIAVGGFVNPVQQGLGTVTEAPVTQRIRAVCEAEPDAVWLAEADYPFINLPAFAGAHLWNATQVYADPARWTALDPTGEASSICNRLCRLAVQLTQEDTPRFSLLHEDAVRIELPLQALQRLGITHVLSRRRIPGLTELSHGGGFRIYRVEGAGTSP